MKPTDEHRERASKLAHWPVPDEPTTRPLPSVAVGYLAAIERMRLDHLARHGRPDSPYVFPTIPLDGAIDEYGDLDGMEAYVAPEGPVVIGNATGELVSFRLEHARAVAYAILALADEAESR